MTVSFFSSLNLIYPGKPPIVTVGELRQFCDKLRGSGHVRDSRLNTVELKYGRAIDQDFEATDVINWNENGTLGRMVAYPWNHEKSEGDWAALWRVPENSSLYRAYVCGGSLTTETSQELTAHDPESERSYIVPDCFSISLGPACSGTLETDQSLCVGLMSISLSGNGYFTWQSLDKYWRQVRTAPSLLDLRRIARETFPVPPLGYLSDFHKELGRLFLNRDECEAGDWLVTINETG